MPGEAPGGSCGAHRQIERAVFHQVAQPARRADDDGGSCSQLGRLSLLRHAAEDADRVDAARGARVEQHCVDLLRQLPRRRDAKTARQLAQCEPAPPLLAHVSDRRDAESQRLACAPPSSALRHTTRGAPCTASCPCSRGLERDKAPTIRACGGRQRCAHRIRSPQCRSDRGRSARSASTEPGWARAS